MNENIEKVVADWKQYQLLEEEASQKKKEAEARIKAYLEELGQEEIFLSEAKVSYKAQTRKSFDKKLAEADGIDVAKYETEKSYKVLRIK